MSATGKHALAVSRTRAAEKIDVDEVMDMNMEKKESSMNYRGFVAGVFSGVAKLSGECGEFVYFLPIPFYKSQLI